MKTGNNYSGARWAFSHRRTQRPPAWTCQAVLRALGYVGDRKPSLRDLWV